MSWTRQKIKQAIRQELQIWQIGALPGLAVIALVAVARLTGILQYSELVSLDALLRLRPAESTDQRILIVGIDEQDIRNVATYPIPDANLAALIQTLQQNQPAAIGLDIVRDLPVEPGHADLVKVLQSPNLVGISTVLPDAGLTINPPLALPANQIGFADLLIDSDGFIRRSLLGTPDQQGEYHFSLAFRLAERYLAKQGITAGNGVRDPDAIRFGNTELERVKPNTGGYVQTDANGNQVLINFRAGSQPFRVVSMAEVLAGSVPEAWIRDQIVLIGITSLSDKDIVNAGALIDRESSLVYGVEIHAHAVSQIVSAVLDQRPLLGTWAESWEYLWIIGWGLLGIGLGRLIRSPLKLALGIVLTSLALIGICYSLLILGWWIPVAPALLALLLNGIGLTASLFYQHEQTLKARIDERQVVINQTFDAIHNGPLQILARTLRDIQERDMTADPIYTNLQQLNQELRSVYESIRREAQSNRFHISSDIELNLEVPLRELLYEVYSYTLSRDFPCFRTLRVRLETFDAMDEQHLTVDQKKGLCRFLEEALCNVGKHAVGITRLEVICQQKDGKNMIRVIDNGAGYTTDAESKAPLTTKGRGTEQAKLLARQLNGQFQRLPNFPHGTICELVWSATKFGFW